MRGAYYNEWDAYAAQWLRNLIAAGHIPAGDVDERSITEVRADDLKGYTQCHFFAGIGGWAIALRFAGWDDARPVWTGSCPCQPFSAAGKQGGGADDRHLWPVWLRLIRECRPDIIFGEQVEGAVGFGWLDRVFADLEAKDYACGAAVLGAHSVGAPHIRQRLWWVADATNGGREPVAGVGRIREEEVSGIAIPEPSGLRAGTGRLADAERDSGRPGRAGEQPGGGVEAPGTGPHAEPGRRGDAGGMGHADDARPQGRGRAVGAERAGERAAGANGASERVEHASLSGERSFDRQPSANAQPQEPTGRSGLPFWSSAEWIACADGKARRVEPGIFPLAHGVPARVGKLRAAGNAIVPQVAATFIKASMIAIDDVAGMAAA